MRAGRLQVMLVCMSTRKNRTLVNDSANLSPQGLANLDNSCTVSGIRMG